MNPIIQRRHRRRPDLDMASLIDVVFLLLIFFMLVSSVERPRRLDLDLPTGGEATTDAAMPIRVIIDGDGETWLADRQMPQAALVARLTELSADDPELAVLIEMDRSLEVQRLVTLLDQLKTAGVTQLDLATADHP